MGKKIVYIVVVFVSCFFFLSCSGKKGEDISLETIVDDAIRQYDSVDFSRYSNLELLVRERRVLTDAIHISTVSYGKDSINPMGIWYGVVYRYRLFGVVSIPKKFSRFREYISDDSLRFIVRNFSKLNVGYLKVDKYKNVFLSPYLFSFEDALLLKIDDSTRVRDNKIIRITGDGTFEHYKGNWYLSGFYIDKYNIKME